MQKDKTRDKFIGLLSQGKKYTQSELAKELGVKHSIKPVACYVFRFLSLYILETSFLFVLLKALLLLSLSSLLLKFVSNLSINE